MYAQLKSLLDLLPDVIIGAEDDDNDSSNDSSDDSSNDSENAGSSSEAGSTNNSNDGGDDYAELKAALEKERAANKAKDKELTKLQKAEQARELANKTEAEQATLKAEAAEEKVTRLAAGLLRNSIDAAIRNAASAFIDPSDAIAGVDRSALIYTQDEDDPSDISIDEKSVEKAVKALATRKPHFIRTGTDDGEKTGSSFGGKRREKKSNDDLYREKYPNL